MSSSQVLYRKYRSQNFTELLGQQSVTNGLQNALKKNLLSHAYLFTGPRGTGKTSSARILAKALNCYEGISENPCNTCDSCIDITKGNSMDVLEFDAASESGVDNIREHIVQVTEYRPTSSRYKIFIIDEVHDLSSKAFDALLKTIEEPPSHVIFILATTEFHKVPLTIRSRCQRYSFQRASIEVLVSRLEYIAEKEGYTYEPPAIHAIAKASDGGFRDALNFLQHAMALSLNKKILTDTVYDQLGLINEDLLDTVLSTLGGPYSESKLLELGTMITTLVQNGKEPKTILDSLLLRCTDHIAMDPENAVSYIMIRSRLSELVRPLREISLPTIWLESQLQNIYFQIHGQAQNSIQKNSNLEIDKEDTTITHHQGQHQHQGQSIEHSPDRNKETITSDHKEEIKVNKSINESKQTNKESKQNNKENKQDDHKHLEPNTHDQKTSTQQPNNQLTEFSAIWKEVTDNFQKISKSAHAKLTKSTVEDIVGNKITISFSRSIDLDWVQSKPKLIQTICEELKQVTGSDEYEFNFIQKKNSVNKSTENSSQNQSYEAPLTGNKLYQNVTSIFNI